MPHVQLLYEDKVSHVSRDACPMYIKLQNKDEISNMGKDP